MSRAAKACPVGKPHPPSHRASKRTLLRPTVVRTGSLVATLFLGAAAACASRPPAPVALAAASSASSGAPSSGAPSSGSSASGAASTVAVDPRGPTSEHADAIGRLLDAPWGTRVDKRRIVSLPLPDADQWTHVKFWGVTTLAGFRYGDDHHAVAAVFTFASKKSPATVDSCAARFDAWGRAQSKAFELTVGDARIDAVPWTGGKGELKIFVFDAERRSIFGTSRYPSAYAVYPAWTDACLVVGVSIADRAVGEPARALRDRLVRDALPGLVIKPDRGPSALEAAIDVDE